MTTQWQEGVLMQRTQSIDWYAPGQSQVVVIGDEEIHVKLVNRKGRKGRIAITAPAGATFVKQPVGPSMAHQSVDEAKGDSDVHDM